MSATPDEKRTVPLYRNPWLYAVVIGLIFITFIRSWTRHEPDPPPVLGTIDSFTLTDDAGVPFTVNAQMEPFLVSLAPANCPAPCEEYLDELRRVQKGFDTWEQKVNLVTLEINPIKGSSKVSRQNQAWNVNWTVLHGPREEVDPIVAGSLFQFHEDNVPANAFDALQLKKVVLIDTKLQVRGYYPLTREGLNEAFHRAIHVRLKP